LLLDRGGRGTLMKMRAAILLLALLSQSQAVPVGRTCRRVCSGTDWGGFGGGLFSRDPTPPVRGTPCVCEAGCVSYVAVVLSTGCEEL
jgi:hypothetical protein